MLPSPNGQQYQATHLPQMLGASRNLSSFRVQISRSKPDSSILVDLLCGRAVAHPVKGYLDIDTCETIGRNANSLLGAVRSDVPALKLGADHFGKSTDEYFSEVAATRELLNRLFQGSIDVPDLLRSDLQQCLEPVMTIRPARHRGHSAGRVRAVRWTGSGSLALGIHDDSSQLTQTAQAGFEIQEVRVPVAANIYPIAEPGCGKLRVFNLRIGRDLKSSLHIEHTGYPVPDELLCGVPFLDVAVDAGDLLLLDGRYLHCVTAGAAGRLLLNCFAGLLADGETVVTWT
jgi:hypothetical protein